MQGSRYEQLRELWDFLEGNREVLPVFGQGTWKSLAFAVRRKADAQDTGNAYLEMTYQAAAVEFTNKLIDEMLNDQGELLCCVQDAKKER